MKKYKGVYIDGTFIHNEKEAEDFLKKIAIRSYKIAVEVFCHSKDYSAAILVDEKAEYLYQQFGMDWDEIEEIEISVMKSIA